MTTLIYGVAKLLAYAAWCYLGLRLVRPPAATVAAAFRLGAVRWCIGLAFGIAVFFMVGSIDAQATARTYFLVYTPVRAVEWGLMAWLILSRASRQSASLALLPFAPWCLGGMLVSFLTDFLSPEGLQGRFCVGRCLC